MSATKPNSPAPAVRKEKFTTLSGVPLERLYTPGNLASWDPGTSLGFPGEYPFTRGIYPTIYRGRFWTLRQYAAFASPVQSNQRHRHLLSQGQTGPSIA